MMRFYLVPPDVVIQNGTIYRGPKYFKWRFGAGIDCKWSPMRYGFVPTWLILARDITQIDHDALILNSDVYSFPESLDGPVNDPSIDVFFEDLNIPTDWLTPSTTWLELLRQLAGMFQFNQRYSGISKVRASIFDNATLDTRLRQMTDQEQAWFLAAVDSFGFDSSQVNDNSRLRLLVKRAGTYWEDKSFVMGGVEF